MGRLLSTMHKGLVEAGCDEAGRGCLAGPVTAAAVILPEGFSLPELDDSKKLSEKTRYKLRPIIEEKAIAFAVAFIYQDEIDEINILRASFKAMHQAVDKLKTKPQMLLIDGNRFDPYNGIPHECIIKGDGKYLSIAAASILAKTYRDDYMDRIDKDFPEYGWISNKGYPTSKHRDAIKVHGDCIHHRKSFTLIPPEQLELF